MVQDFIVQEFLGSNRIFSFFLEREGEFEGWALSECVSNTPGWATGIHSIQSVPREVILYEGLVKNFIFGDGKIIVWDRGTYTMKKMSDLSHMYNFNGEKIRGGWEMRPRDGSYYIVKMDDEGADDSEIPLYRREKRSVISGRTIKHLAKQDGILDFSPYLTALEE